MDLIKNIDKFCNSYFTAPETKKKAWQYSNLVRLFTLGTVVIPLAVGLIQGANKLLASSLGIPLENRSVAPLDGSMHAKIVAAASRALLSKEALKESYRRQLSSCIRDFAHLGSHLNILPIWYLE